MTLLDRLREAQAPYGPECTMGEALRAMPAPLRAEYEAVLADRHWHATKIAALLGEDGHNVRPEAVRRHRNRMDGKPTGDQACACRVA